MRCDFEATLRIRPGDTGLLSPSLGEPSAYPVANSINMARSQAWVFEKSLTRTRLTADR